MRRTGCLQRLVGPEKGVIIGTGVAWSIRHSMPPCSGGLETATDPGGIYMDSIIDYHRRLRLGGFELVPTSAGQCRAKVVLGWEEDGDFVGVAEGADSPSGQLRSAAEATARALETAAKEKVGLKVLAVKAIEGFDTIIVLVSLGSRVQDQTERLVGSCLIKGQPARGAVLAVLSATNRLLGKVLAEMRSGTEPG